MRLRSVWQFARPHTMIGSALSAPALSAFVGAPSVDAIPAALCANLYVTGLNQITDVEIDRINKPQLPLPNGDLTRKEAISIVALAAIASIFFSFRSRALVGTVASSMAIGTLYSLEPFRWKKSSFLAALSIVLVRGVIINIGFASHALGRLACPVNLVAFFCVFAGVIAAMKDVPDTRGDAMHELPSYALTLGRRTVCFVSAAVMTIAFAIVAAQVRTIWSLCSISLAVAIMSKTIILLRDGSHSAMTTLYLFYWKCFYAAYLILFLHSSVQSAAKDFPPLWWRW